MLPGKKFKPEDFVLILRQRFWLLLLPFAIVAAGTAVYARKLPDVFRSDTLILVVPQRVPESYVKSTITTRIEDRLQSITQQILSRTRLERIIQDFDLYAQQRTVGIMEDIVEKMRADIVVQVVKGDAFRVSYVGDDPKTVMRVTDRLASLFIEENLRDREVLAEGTNQFLESQLEDARRRLIEHEKKLETYRQLNAGQLPSQLESNIQAITNTEMQVQSIVEALDHDRERLVVLERQLADAEESAAAEDSQVAMPVANQPDSNAPAPTAAQQLAAAKSTLAAMALRLKADHPDVQRMKRAIRDLEAQAAAEALATPLSDDPRQPVSATDLTRLNRRRRMDALRAELAQLNRQIVAKQNEEKRLRTVAGNYQHRVEMLPTRESEMSELTRDYATLQTIYTTLLQKKEDSKVAANLERRQIGEQFKLLDPARLPEKPFSPDRRFINLAGMGAGLLIGLTLIAFLEYRDSSFKTDDEIISALALPVLAVVPLMQSTHERRRSWRYRFVLGLGCVTTVFGCLAVVVYTFVR